MLKCIYYPHKLCACADGVPVHSRRDALKKIAKFGKANNLASVGE